MDLRVPLCLWLLTAGPGLSAEPLSLAALLDEAESNAPTLRAAAARVAAAETLPDQAGALPDPMVETSIQHESLSTWTLGETQMSNLAFTWTQELPYPGKRALRVAAARTEAGVAEAETTRLRLELRALVKAAYIELHRIHRVRALIVESRGLLESLRDSARVRFETGQAPLEGVLGAGAEIARLDVALVALDADRAHAEARLAWRIGRPPGSEFATAEVGPVELTFEWESLAHAGVERSATIGVLRAATRRDEARIAALRRESKPDFSWSAGYAYRGSLDPMVMGMFGVRLPLYRDRKQLRAVAQAEHDLEALRQQTADAELESATAAHDAMVHAATTQSQVRILEESVIPQSRAALDAATAAYATGRVDFGTALAHLESLLDDSRRIEELRAERLTMLALIEPEVGHDLVVPAEESP